MLEKVLVALDEYGGSAVISVSMDRERGKSKARSNPTQMGEVMPAFSFEKISSPARRGQQPSSSPSPKKPRSIIHQIVDRFTEARARKGADEMRSVSARRKAKSADK
jgi:hypothetical protein